jgi:hypothetical protein
MALVKCPECRRNASEKAAACPHCGHPIAGYDDYGPSDLAREMLAENRTERSHAKGLLMTFGIAALIVVGTYTGEKEKPSCKSDWHLCFDNADLVNNYDSGMIDAHVSCQTEAEKRAKYGSPKWPFAAFGTYQRGSAYLNTGVATLIEPDAQFSNAFGAMVHSTVTCTYDLNQKKVLEAMVAPN